MMWHCYAYDYDYSVFVHFACLYFSWIDLFGISTVWLFTMSPLLVDLVVEFLSCFVYLGWLVNISPS